MSYIGNNLTIQQYAPTISYLSGNGSTTAFTLPIAVVSAAQIIVTVENVIQNPSSAFSVSGTTLTFTSAPPSGTNNIWVEYTSLQTNTIAPSAGTVQNTSFGNLTSIPFAVGGPIGGGNSSIMKNRIINGAMVIDQRNAGASVTPSSTSYVSCDRWYPQLTQASKFSVQQQTSTVPVGFNYSQQFSVVTPYSVGAGDYFGTEQRIEGYNLNDLGYGTANAKTTTLSFWAYANNTGTYSGSIFNPIAGNRSYVFTYALTANTWTYVTIPITGDTSSSLGSTTNSSGLVVRFTLTTGSNFQTSTLNSWQTGNYGSTSGSFNWIGTSGATFYITGVQLEVGSSATGFEYRQYQQELALCQRYYQIISYKTPSAYGCVNTMTLMRSAPSVVQTAPPIGGSTTATIDATYANTIWIGNAAQTVLNLSAEL